jgi:hypothetical protein
LGGAALTIIRHGSFLGEASYSIEITTKYHAKASARRFSLPSRLNGCGGPGRVHTGSGEVMKRALAPFALSILAAALLYRSKAAGRLRRCASSPLSIGLTARLFSAIPLAGQRNALAGNSFWHHCAMFSKLLGNVKKQRKLNSWKSSALGRAINEHIKSYDKAWKHLKKEEKEQLAAEFNKRISAVLESPRSVIGCRRELVGSIVAYTDLQVLCLTEEDKENNPIFKDMKRISSELRDHIYKCSLRNDELNKFIEANEYDETKLMEFARNRCDVHRYYAYGFDIVRKSIESTSEKDWFLPLLQSSMIISESNYRKFLGFPAIVTAIDSSFHSSFIDMAMNGEQEPLLTWERRYAKSHGETV